MTMPDVAADEPTPHAGLLGKPNGGLRLKVSKGSRHRGQLVDLHRQKCTVGSAEDCSLRLVEPGIAPVECVILRGAVANVVRWIDVRQIAEGGELFQDELLRPGDQFRVGPLHLEVLEDQLEAAAPAAPSSDSLMSACLSRLERLENALTEQFRAEQDRAEQFRAEQFRAEQFRAEQFRAEQFRAEQFRAEQFRAEQQVAASTPENSPAFAQLTQQLLDLQTHSDVQRSRWDAEQQKLEAANADQSRQLQVFEYDLGRLQRELKVLREESQQVLATRDAIGSELEERTRQLTEQTRLWPERQSAWEAERARWESLVKDQTERLRDVEARLEVATQSQLRSAETLEAWENECRGLQDKLDAADVQIQQLKEELEQHRQATLNAESRLQELELQSATVSQSASTEATEEIHQELTRLQTQYQCERERWEAERRILNEDLQAQSQLLEQQQLALLRTPTKPLPEEPPVLHQEEPPVLHQLVIETEEQVDESAATCATYRPAWTVTEVEDDPMSRFLSRSAGSMATPADEAATYGGPSLSAYLPETADVPIEREAPSYIAQTYAQEELEEENRGLEHSSIPAVEQPTSTAEILKRLRESHVWSDNPAEASAYRPAYRNPTNDEISTPKDRVRDDDPPVAAAADWKAPANSGLDDDESIEAYMNRLLKRVRVGSQEDDEESSSPSPAPTTRTPMMELPTPVVEDIEDEPSQPKISLEEYRPRSAAPEQSGNLNAMRALANDNARTAVAAHARRNWASFMKLKLVVSGFAISAIAASMTFFWGNPILIALGSCVGIAVMFYWVRQARTYRQLLVESMMLDTGANAAASSASKNKLEPGAGA